MSDFQNNRIIWIDYLKGLCLLFIVFSHLGNLPKLIQIFIKPTDLLWVPVFFFLSGMLFNSEKYTFFEFIKRKTFQLLIPYFSLSLLISLFDWNLYLNTKSFLHKTCQSILWGDGALKGSPLWFIVVLYLSSVWMKILITFRIRYRLLLVILIPIAWLGLDIYKIRLPLHIDSSLCAMFVMYCGHLFKTFYKSNFVNNKSILNLVVVSLILFFVGLKNGLGLLNYNTTHKLWSLPSSIGGCICLSFLFQKTERLWEFVQFNFLPWIAQNGLIILALHCLINFYLDVVLRFVHLDNIYFIFILRIFVIFAVLYFIALPLMHKVKPRLWGIK